MEARGLLPPAVDRAMSKEAHKPAQYNTADCTGLTYTMSPSCLGDNTIYRVATLARLPGLAFQVLQLAVLLIYSPSEPRNFATPRLTQFSNLIQKPDFIFRSDLSATNLIILSLDRVLIFL